MQRKQIKIKENEIQKKMKTNKTQTFIITYNKRQYNKK